MSAGMLGYFIGSFTVAFLLPVVWLLVCKAIPPLRRRLGVSYGIAMALAFVTGVLQGAGGGPLDVSLMGSVLCAAVLFWQYNRAKKKTAAATPTSV